MTPAVGLLRGVNLGKRQVRKDALIAAATRCGLHAPRTLLASGNLLFESDRDAATLEDDLRRAIHAESGVDAEVFLRTGDQIAAALAVDPFPEATRERPSYVTVTFHREAVTAAMIEAVCSLHDGPERLHAHGRELFIDFPDGQGRSTLDAALRKARPALPVGTARNRNTVAKLAALLAR